MQKRRAGVVCGADLRMAVQSVTSTAEMAGWEARKDSRAEGVRECQPVRLTALTVAGT